MQDSTQTGMIKQSCERVCLKPKLQNLSKLRKNFSKTRKNLPKRNYWAQYSNCVILGVLLAQPITILHSKA